MVTIRPAGPSDCAVLADLVLLSDSGLLSVLFPGGPRTTITYLASCRRNPFSYEHALVVDSEGEVVGAALGSSRESMRREVLPMALLLARHYGLRLPSRLLLLARAGSATGGIAEGDFYLNNIAVVPRERGFGHGSRLIRHLEQLLAERGSRRIVLDVDPENEQAALFYARLGYREERRISITPRRGMRFEYRRLWKPIRTTALGDEPPMTRDRQ